MKYISALTVIIILLLGACSFTPITPLPSPTPIVIASLTATWTPSPTSLPGQAPTRQSEPTETPIPTIITAPPTATPVPTTPIAQNVELVGHLGGAIEAMSVQGDYAYAGGRFGLTILDVSNPAQPVEIGHLALPVVDIEVAGDYAYIAAGDAGLHLVDVSDPTAPVEVGRYNTSDRATEVAVMPS